MEEILKQILTELKDLKQGQQNLEKGQQGMESRLQNLEKGQQSMESRLQNLEEGQHNLEMGQLSLSDKLQSFEIQVNNRFNQVDKKLDILSDAVADLMEFKTDTEQKLKKIK
ncbi:MAG: hypothetical protein QHH06_08155 [Clostridiales bacterium]|jgi:exonuclease VII small subunit|nr:hypothetical protein [Eubacteriales bacterium]MDH7566439.1 hypothetical protein [Clostridiales bacterium]